MTDELFYQEKLRSNKTEVLFIALTLLFLSLFIWYWRAHPDNTFRYFYLVFFLFFLFYSINYRILSIRLSPQSLKLTFGLFSWTVSVSNIADCRLDHLSSLMKYGGAGIHFMTIRNRYRASFNFLEHPRVVIALKENKGQVRDISFSTRNPDEILRLLRTRISKEKETAT